MVTTVSNSVLHSWKLLGDQILKIQEYIYIYIKLYGDAYEIDVLWWPSDTSRHVKSQRYTSETNLKFSIDYILIKKKKKDTTQWLFLPIRGLSVGSCGLSSSLAEGSLQKETAEEGTWCLHTCSDLCFGGS